MTLAIPWEKGRARQRERRPATDLAFSRSCLTLTRYVIADFW